MSKTQAKNNLNIILEVSDYLQEILKKNTIGQVHSVFANGINFKIDHRLIYLSKHPSQGLSAIGMRPQTTSPNLVNTLGLVKPGDLVKLNEDYIYIYMRPNDLILNLESIIYVNLKAEELSLPKADFLKRILDQIDQADIFKNSGFQEKSLYEIFSQIKETGRVQDHISSLFGRGMGLTPSGDDFLQAYLLMTKVFDQEKSFEDALVAYLQDHETTDVSMAYYEAILSGHFPSQVWKNLFDVGQKTRSEDVEALLKEIEQIKSYGHTSGRDMLLACIVFIKENLSQGGRE